MEDPIDRGVLCVQVLQEQEQATEEEQGVNQCQELEDPVRFIIRTWPWPDDQQGLPQVLRKDHKGGGG